jgi:hypothetical protein
LDGVQFLLSSAGANVAEWLQAFQERKREVPQLRPSELWTAESRSG